MPDVETVATKELEGMTLTCEVVKRKYGNPYYCGFARFDELPLEQDRLLAYVPVHGRIHYAEREDDGKIVYGFACNHPGDDTDPKVHAKAWILEEAERMARSIIALGGIEKQIVEAMDEVWKQPHA